MSAQNAHAHEDRLLDFAYGELPASEAQSLEQHVQGCARCSKALSDIRGVRSTMAHLSVEPPPDAGLESLLAYAQQSARRAAAGPEPKPSRWRRWLLPVVGLASVSTFGLLTLEVSKDVNLQPTLTQKAEPAAAKADQALAYDDAPARPAAPPPAMQAAPAPAPMEGALLDRAQRKQAEASVGAKGGGEGRPSDWMNAGSGGALLERRRGAEAKKQMSGFGMSKSEAKRDALSAPSAVMDDEAKDSALAQGTLGGSRSGLGVSTGIGNGGGGSDKLRKEEEGSLRLGGASYGRGLATDEDALAEEVALPPPADSVVAGAPMAPSTPPMPTGSTQRNQQAPGKAMAAAEQMPAPVQMPAPEPLPATVSKPKSAPAEKAARADALTTSRDLSRQAQEAASQGDRARESQLLRAALAAGATGSERLSLLSRLCEAEYARGRRTEGAEVCARILSEAPDSEAARRAGLWLGQGGAATVPVKKAPAQAAPVPSKQ
ncbi:anti-sigma factor family protein [Corallococcus terminator]|uniref:Zf-HC2 domain-containing protein n=1 Tax=Corallococcus terminator TaxID=2316733 RepID=A0A3A8IMC9_9BACT|nr:zf-HC2 domain-containing protein [Corallococcus terminator]RKG83848.1 zf-HC2 domain-containing protein [Corallococcus terminator]